MSKFNYPKMYGATKNVLQTVAASGITMIVLGVVILASCFIFNFESNLPLLAGLFLIIAGCAGFVDSIKKEDKH